MGEHVVITERTGVDEHQAEFHENRSLRLLMPEPRYVSRRSRRWKRNVALVFPAPLLSGLPASHFSLLRASPLGGLVLDTNLRGG
jgi:hypothetical protein